MKMINTTSFEVNGAFEFTSYSDGSWSQTVFGTIELTIDGKTRRVPARRYDGSSTHLNGITAYGITGRYRTGMVAWPGTVEKRDEWNNEIVHFGFDSRSGKHRKATISFA